MTLLRRSLVALAISLGVHAALVVSLAGVAVFHGWQVVKTVDIELTSTSTKVDELPFGPPPPPPGSARAKPAGRRPRPKPTAAEGSVKVAAADAGAPADAGAGGADAGDGGAADAADARDAQESDGRDGGMPRVARDDGRPPGPAGSKVTALLRLDRLRAGPDAPGTIAAVDGLLRHLPDRRRLLDGTGLDLYRDFDALFIATPNPMDDAVTFLVARHRLSDAAVMAALGKGGEAAGRPITWQTEGGRPLGLRARKVDDPVAQPGDLPRFVDRDDRIFVLPQKGLVVMAPPAYAPLLLGRRARPEGGAAGPPPELRWKEIIARIDAEDGAIGEDAVLMMTAANLVGPKSRRVDPAVPQKGPGGLAWPNYATLQSGISPAPFLELRFTFERAAEAAGWAAAWPGLKQTWLGSPILLFSGFSSIVARATLVQEDETVVVVRTHGTGEELKRLLGMIGNLLGPGRR